LISSNSTQQNAAFSAVSGVLGGYKAGFELCEGSHPSALERFIVLRVKGTPRLLLPHASPAMNTATHSFLGNRPGVRLLPRLLKTAAWAGGPFSSLSSVVSLISPTEATCPLRELLTEVLGRNDFQIALRLSFGRPNAKTVAMAISDAGEALCFAKFGTEAMTNDLVAHESTTLEQLENTNLPVVIPTRLYSGSWAGCQHVLITASLPLEPLPPDANLAHIAADNLASLKLESNVILTNSDHWRQTALRIKELSESDNQALIDSVNKIEQHWGALEFDFGPSHGDWTRANLGIVKGQIAALDWERCTRFAPRGIDIAHFAIAENSQRLFGQSIDVERVARSVRLYLESAGLPPKNAEPLIILALLEMVLRFKSAQNVGLRSKDSKFGIALNACIRKWAI